MAPLICIASRHGPADLHCTRAQWAGWHFTATASNPYGYAEGRSLFGAPTTSTVWGAYCVWDRSTLQISYCYPEGYTIVGPSSPSTCALYASGPSSAPPSAAGLAGPPQRSSSVNEKLDAVLVFVILCFLLILCVVVFVAVRQTAAAPLIKKHSLLSERMVKERRLTGIQLNAETGGDGGTQDPV